MDSTLRSLGGCGKFQVLVVIMVFTSEFTSPFSLMFMSFGNYNPGWRCLDNDNVTTTAVSVPPLSNDTFTNASNTVAAAAAAAVANNNSNNSEMSSQPSAVVYVKEQCPDFEACRRVEFNPESLTIVSQWKLICDKAWIPTIIISIQMVGVMIGAYFGGYMGDKIGRKLTICLNTGLNVILNLVAATSVSWHMFAIVRFFIGITYASMIGFPFVYASELTPTKWRSFLASLPAWNVGATLFAVVAMVTKDWRQIHLVTAAITLIFFFPLLWIPESIRWLTVQGKIKKAARVANRIAKLNRRPAPREETFVHLAAQSQSGDGKGHKYSWYDLWRRDVRWYTLILGFIWISMAIIYYTTSFGAKNLVGDIYVNLIILYLTEIPVSAISTVTPNILGRKWATFAFFSVATSCLVGMVFMDRFGEAGYRGTSIFVFVLFTRFSINGAWYVLYTLTAEIYPTVIRGTSLGYGSCLSRIGGIVAPYLIPKSSESNFISFTVMACLISICSILLLFLPETKGRDLLETWSDEVLPNTTSSPESSSMSAEHEEGSEMLKKKPAEVA